MGRELGFIIPVLLLLLWAEMSTGGAGAWGSEQLDLMILRLFPNLNDSIKEYSPKCLPRSPLQRWARRCSPLGWLLSRWSGGAPLV